LPQIDAHDEVNIVLRQLDALVRVQSRDALVRVQLRDPAGRGATRPGAARPAPPPARPGAGHDLTRALMRVRVLMCAS